MRQYSFKELLIALKGQAMQDANEWDRTRHIMYVVAKTMDSKKKIRKVADILAIPLIDKGEEADRQALQNKLVQAHNRLKRQIADGNTGT